MRNLLRILLVATVLPGCSADRAERPASSALPAPIATASHPYAGFWKDGHCEDEFGLEIAPAGPNLYSVSFCGPGGCFEPGTYRPNTPIVGDPAYRVIDDNTLGIGVQDGSFARYSRCPAAPDAH